MSNLLTKAAVLAALPGLRTGLWNGAIGGFQASNWFINAHSGGSPRHLYGPSADGTNHALAAPSGGSGNTCDNTTPGCLWLPPIPAGSHVYRVARVRRGIDSNDRECTLLIDRYVEALSVVVGSGGVNPQTVNTVALPARAPTNGVGVLIGLEMRAAAGTSSVTFTVTYTNDQGGTSTTPSTTTANNGAFFAVGTFQPVPLAAGDLGVQSVQSINVTATTGTGSTPNASIVLYQPILQVAGFRADQVPGGSEVEDWFDTALCPIDPAACVNILVFTPGAALFEFDLLVD